MNQIDGHCRPKNVLKNRCATFPTMAPNPIQQAHCNACATLPSHEGGRFTDPQGGTLKIDEWTFEQHEMPIGRDNSQAVYAPSLDLSWLTDRFRKYDSLHLSELGLVHRDESEIAEGVRWIERGVPGSEANDT